ncbi:MAG: ParB/RepB/Spo0J family partition protein [Glaciecola sp.]|jgi:ParB family chromosome partitioning protein|nr:ParB/RepB/Spo0J family partition protein [Glaciecola sp.]MDG1815660.1 ParB/RepB/Spo0J family partition protein [Glaciecola sp.]MDG2098179.1 ParB/RepB/Spo0J family partition protein [Glaciecola sp.]
MAGKSKGLGRGLDALLTSSRATAPDEVTSDGQPSSVSLDGTLRHIPIEFLQPGKYQPRKDMSPEALEELSTSIQAQGIIQPIVVRSIGENKYEIIAGERRWRASQMAKLHEVPCLIKEVPDEAAVAIALIENIQREDLNAMEEAQALDRLMKEFELTHQEVAQAVGKSRTTVTNLLRLNSLTDEVKKLLEYGDIEMGHARTLLALSDDMQVEAGKHVAGKGLSVRETENYVRKLLNPPTQVPPKKVDPDVAQLQTDLAEKIGAQVKINANKQGKGKVVIDFADLDQLDGILGFFK